MRMIPLLIVLASLPAVATETAPAVPAAPAPTAAPATVSAEPSPTSEAPAAIEGPVAAPAAAAPVAAPAAQAAVQEFKAPSGYKKKAREGKTVYCRNETPVGTRFATEYCFTQADLERIEKNKMSVQRDVSMRTKMCTTGSACSGGG